MNDVVIIDGFRTPYAKSGTAFKNVPAVDLGAAVMKELIARTGIDRGLIDEVIVGNAGMPAEAANIARVIALRAGIPESVPAYSVQRNCASGMQAAASAFTQILAGMSKVDAIALGLLWFASTMIGGLTGAIAFMTTEMPTLREAPATADTVESDPAN